MERCVRVIYLVPSDRPDREDFAIATAAAIRHVQRWYWERMGNRRTFELHNPVVEVVKLSHDSRWFTDHRVDDDRTQWFWRNVLDDAFAATRSGFHDLQNRWIFYIDAENQPDQAVGGNAGVALLPRHDLLGLVGKSIFPGEMDICRWVGGLGHELGHAFELPHPAGYERSANDPSAGSLMALGFRSYPDTFLNREDIEALSRNPFFFLMNLDQPVPDCNDLSSG
jgi:hypothetical protein